MEHHEYTAYYICQSGGQCLLSVLEFVVICSNYIIIVIFDHYVFNHLLVDRCLNAFLLSVLLGVDSCFC